MNRGSKNLIILGVGAIIITILTTAISLIIYHESGDIYLDRSRPGFLPDTEEIDAEKENDEEDYIFSESGTLTSSELEELLENFDAEFENLDSISNPFSSSSLSDEKLGISDSSE